MLEDFITYTVQLRLKSFGLLIIFAQIICIHRENGFRLNEINQNVKKRERVKGLRKQLDKFPQWKFYKWNHFWRVPQKKEHKLTTICVKDVYAKSLNV